MEEVEYRNELKMRRRSSRSEVRNDGSMILISRLDQGSPEWPVACR